ncbi:MAG: transglycosylase SLT domain-containing protein [Treponema sp.]|nr:transglycosylase SLT domain-containing protein [Treponema sp.]
MKLFLKDFTLFLLLFFFPFCLFAQTELDANQNNSDTSQIEKTIEKEKAEDTSAEKKELFNENLPEKINDSDVLPPLQEENTNNNSESDEISLESQEFQLYPLISEWRDRPEVEAWRQYYLSSEKRVKLLHDILENAMEYRLFVRKTVQGREVPGELEYLPVVESGYKTSAKSRSGALGMWQFMENSVKPFLTLTEYVDERLDPWKSTEGGLSKLQDNYRYFKDWLLAIGAYNCGAGAMNKAINRGQSRDFWYLAENGFLSSQTKDYVPKLIAIADLAVNSKDYEIELPDHAEEYALLANERDGLFDYVTVQKPYSISAIARDMRMEERQLKKLNPALTKGFTPPAAKYNIRVPLGMKATCEEVISKLQPIEFPFQYKVVKGDSLWSISRKFGTTVQAICETNGIEENAILKIGKILYIPGK